MVAFGESPAEHSKNKQTRNWSLGPDHIDEEDEYVNLGVYKNYCGSFSKNVDENIAKTRKKDGSKLAEIEIGAEIWSLT